jgi:hypothetical protein
MLQHQGEDVAGDIHIVILVMSEDDENFELHKQVCRRLATAHVSISFMCREMFSCSHFCRKPPSTCTVNCGLSSTQHLNSQFCLSDPAHNELSVCLEVVAGQRVTCSTVRLAPIIPLCFDIDLELSSTSCTPRLFASAGDAHNIGQLHNLTTIFTHGMTTFSHYLCCVLAPLSAGAAATAASV